MKKITTVALDEDVLDLLEKVSKRDRISKSTIVNAILARALKEVLKHGVIQTK